MFLQVEFWFFIKEKGQKADPAKKEDKHQPHQNSCAVSHKKDKWKSYNETSPSTD